MHLGHNKDPGKAEAKHRPQLGLLVKQGDERTVDQNKNFKQKSPIPIEMYPGKKEGALHHQQKHIEEADQMAGPILHRVVPKGVDDGPSKDIAVVFTQHTAGFGQKKRAFDPKRCRDAGSPCAE